MRIQIRCQAVVGSLGILTLGWILGFWLSWSALLSAEVVYDNTRMDMESFWPSMDEYGDEVKVAGTARTLTALHMEYYGDFEPATGAETVRIRLYANDGPKVPVADWEISSPGTLLYESDRRTIYQGYNVLSLNQLSVPIPETVIWTVQFEGVSGNHQLYGYPNRVGLPFYDPMVIGDSYDDFWMKREGQWSVYSFGGGIKANFPVRLEAGPDPALEIVSQTEQTNGWSRLRLNGPGFGVGRLECSVDQTNWSALRSFFFQGKAVDYTDIKGRPGESRYYRLVPATNDFLQIVSGKTNVYGEFELEVAGPQGQRFVMEHSSNMVDWTSLNTNDLRSLVYTYKYRYPLTNFPGKFFRARAVEGEPFFIGNFYTPTNGFCGLRLFGPPGRRCVIQTSEDARTWDSVITNLFSFNGGILLFMDEKSSPSAHRYYRAVLK